MVKPKVSFRTLRQFLLEQGFNEIVVPGSHIGFHHASGAEIMLPVYRSEHIVAPRHLLLVRVTLDARALMEPKEFDDFVEFHTAAQSA